MPWKRTKTYFCYRTRYNQGFFFICGASKENILENIALLPQTHYGDYGEEKILLVIKHLVTFKGFIQ